MKYIGVHIDAGENLAEAPVLASRLGARAFSFCPVDARRWSMPAYAPDIVEGFKSACQGVGYTAECILPHASLLLNLCSPDARKLKLSRVSLVDQMSRCAMLGLTMLNFHPGATMKEMSDDEALSLTAQSINYALDKTTGVVAVIENTAGQGSNIGYTFEQIAAIIDRVEDKTRVGTCIDTCHASAAGYDMSTPEGYETVWNKFDSVVGRGYLRGMHLNDAMRPAGSRIDRHAPIGKGTLGNDFFAMLMADRRLDGIPMILETPDPSLWHIEVDWLKAHDDNT